MKQFLSRAWQVVKTIWGVTAGVFTLIFIIMCFTDQQQWVVYAVMAVIFGLLAILSLRKKKPKPAQSPEAKDGTPLFSVSFSQDIPEEVLRDMRKSYTKAQAIRDAEIMRESFLLAQRTLDFDVFFMRAELSMKKAFTLLQAEQAKCKGVAALNLSKGANSVIETNTALKIDFLDRAVDAEIKAAVKLKTPKSQSKRLEAFLNKLSVYEDEFCVIEEHYNNAVVKVQNMIAQIEKAGEV